MDIASLPAWERGSKQLSVFRSLRGKEVAPCLVAWTETMTLWCDACSGWLRLALTRGAKRRVGLHRDRGAAAEAYLHDHSYR